MLGILAVDNDLLMIKANDLAISSATSFSGPPVDLKRFISFKFFQLLTNHGWCNWFERKSFSCSYWYFVRFVPYEVLYWTIDAIITLYLFAIYLERLTECPERLCGRLYPTAKGLERQLVYNQGSDLVWMNLWKDSPGMECFNSKDFSSFTESQINPSIECRINKNALLQTVFWRFYPLGCKRGVGNNSIFCQHYIKKARYI